MSVLRLIYGTLWPAISRPKSRKSFRCGSLAEEIFESHIRSHRCLEQKKKSERLKKLRQFENKKQLKEWGTLRESSKITLNRSNYFFWPNRDKQETQTSVMSSELSCQSEEPTCHFNTFAEILIEFLRDVVFDKLSRFNLSLFYLISLSCCM